MVTQIIAIAALSMRELTRRRIFYVLGAFGVGMVLLSLPLVQLSVGQWERLIGDVGLGTANIELDLLAAILGASLLAADVERKSVYIVLARPIQRRTVVLGRFFGLLGILLAMLLIMGLSVWCALQYIQGTFSLGFYQAWVGIGLESSVVVALALVFSSFSSSLLSAIFSLSFVVLGHAVSELAFFASRAHAESSRIIGQALALILPNLEQFNFKAAASYEQVVSQGVVAHAVVAALTYVTLFLWIACVIFSRQDLK